MASGGDEGDEGEDGAVQCDRGGRAAVVAALPTGKQVLDDVTQLKACNSTIALVGSDRALWHELPLARARMPRPED